MFTFATVNKTKLRKQHDKNGKFLVVALLKVRKIVRR